MNRAEGAFPETFLGGGHWDVMQAKSHFESSALPWNRKGNLPRDLKLQLHFGCHSVEGTW